MNFPDTGHFNLPVEVAVVGLGSLAQFIADGREILDLTARSDNSGCACGRGQQHRIQCRADILAKLGCALLGDCCADCGPVGLNDLRTAILVRIWVDVVVDIECLALECDQVLDCLGQVP